MTMAQWPRGINSKPLTWLCACRSFFLDSPSLTSSELRALQLHPQDSVWLLLWDEALRGQWLSALCSFLASAPFLSSLHVPVSHLGTPSEQGVVVHLKIFRPDIGPSLRLVLSERRTSRGVLNFKLFAQMNRALGPSQKECRMRGCMDCCLGDPSG